MSQETGLFSVRRPREVSSTCSSRSQDRTPLLTETTKTLGSVSHNASAIPMPASAMKRSSSTNNQQRAPNTVQHARSVSGSRMSLAPGRPAQPMFQRSSSGSNLQEMGTTSAVKRQSSAANLLASASGRKSHAPGLMSTPGPQSSLQQLGQSTQRRSSVYSARQSSSMNQMHRQSFFVNAPVPAGVPRDPRPLKDRGYQKQLGQELLDYLTRNNFEMDMKHSLSQNSMVSPTQKDFNMMFQWLYQRIDPNYRFYRNIDQEVPPILKQLRYPFEKSITKSQISAVGGANWSTFLGVLHWMMQLARMMEQYGYGNYDDACAEAGFDVTGDRIIFDFLTDSYHEWLAMEDDQEDKADELLKPHVARMAERFDETNSKYIKQAEMLEAEYKALQEQIDELSKNESAIAQLEEQSKLYEDDRKKFEKYNEFLAGKIDKYDSRSTILKQEMEKAERELREHEQEKADLQAAVDRQGISVADIDRMNTERERLQNGVETTAERLEETKKRVSAFEVDAGKRLDELEHLIQDYNTLGYQVGVIPSTAANAKGHDLELNLSVNPTPDFRASRTRSPGRPESERLLADANSGYQPQHLLNVDLKGAVKAFFVALRKEISERKNTAMQTDAANRDLLSKTREAIEDKQQEVEALEHRVRAAEEECEKTREVCADLFRLSWTRTKTNESDNRSSTRRR